MTPPVPTSPVIGIHDRLYARALVLDDGKTRLAIVICDSCMLRREIVNAAKKFVREEIGFSPNCLLIAATHTHTAVRALHIGNEPADKESPRLSARSPRRSRSQRPPM